MVSGSPAAGPAEDMDLGYWGRDNLASVLESPAGWVEEDTARRVVRCMGWPAPFARLWSGIPGSSRSGNRGRFDYKDCSQLSRLVEPSFGALPG